MTLKETGSGGHGILKNIAVAAMVIIIWLSMQLTQFTTKKTEKERNLIMEENIKRDTPSDLFKGIL